MCLLYKRVCTGRALPRAADLLTRKGLTSTSPLVGTLVGTPSCEGGVVRFEFRRPKEPPVRETNLTRNLTRTCARLCAYCVLSGSSLDSNSESAALHGEQGSGYDPLQF
jgi:hypothetical protein